MSVSMASAQQVDAVIAAPVETAAAAKRSLKKNVAPSEFGGPSKARSAYFLWCDSVRSQFIEDTKKKCETTGEKWAVSMVAKHCGEQWKTVPAELKQEWQSKADAEKVQVAEAEEAWKKTEQYKEFLYVKSAHTKKQRDAKAKEEVDAAGLPKKPQAGYFLFSAEHTSKIIAQAKAAGASLSMTERAQKIKSDWASLGEDGQKPFLERFAANKAKYEEDMKSFQEGPAWKTYQKKLQKNRDEKKENDKIAKNGGVKPEKKAPAKRTRKAQAGGEGAEEEPEAKRQKTEGADDQDNEVEAEGEDENMEDADVEGDSDVVEQDGEAQA